MDIDAAPTGTPEQRAEDVRRFFCKSCDFVLAAAQPEHFSSITVDLPEVAFWGRSNVGKSSLINAITGRKGLARASNTPGRTQQIVFFNMAGRLLFADLPGYGHAKAPKAEIAKWNAFIKYYLKVRPRLRCVLLLIDSRRGVMHNDHEMMDFLDRMAVSYQIVLTKADQIKAEELVQLIEATRQAVRKHPAARPDPIATSADKGGGIADVRDFLLTLAEIG